MSRSPFLQSPPVSDNSRHDAGSRATSGEYDYDYEHERRSIWRADVGKAEAAGLDLEGVGPFQCNVHSGGMDLRHALVDFDGHVHDACVTRKPLPETVRPVRPVGGDDQDEAVLPWPD